MLSVCPSIRLLSSGWPLSANYDLLEHGAVGTRLGKVGVALEAGGLISSYDGRVMIDPMVGFPIRF